MKSKHKISSRQEQSHIDQYRSLYESANDSIFLMSKEKFISCNPKTLEMFGCGENDIVGQTPIKFSPKNNLMVNCLRKKLLKKLMQH